MLFVHSALVALDMHQAVSPSYQNHIPLPDGFALPPHFTAQNAAASNNSGGGPDCDTDDGGAGGHLDIDVGPPLKRRRRSKPKYCPNEKEVEANARHAQAAPVLEAAAAALAAWMGSQQAATLTAALEHAPLSARRGCSSAAADAAPAQQPMDYITLAAMRGVLRPKFSWAGPSAAQLQPPGSMQQQPPVGAECDLFGRLIVAPEGEEEAWGEAGGHPVLVPGSSSFLMSDVKQLPLLLAAAPRGFHCIVIDPPWENKSAHRGAKYPTLPAYNLLRLPLKQLAAPGEGCLVALWVTHRQKLRAFVEEKLLPAWGVRVCATWHWLKVTDAGRPISPLHAPHHRPYETLLLCSMDGVAAPWERAVGDDESGRCRPLPDGLVLAATPAQHSRKPPLDALLRAHLPPKARCLEMFARCLTKGWTSWGNECLRFQGREQFDA